MYVDWWLEFWSPPYQETLDAWEDIKKAGAKKGNQQEAERAWINAMVKRIDNGPGVRCNYVINKLNPKLQDPHGVTFAI